MATPAVRRPSPIRSPSPEVPPGLAAPLLEISLDADSAHPPAPAWAEGVPTANGFARPASKPATAPSSPLLLPGSIIVDAIRVLTPSQMATAAARAPSPLGLASPAGSPLLLAGPGPAAAARDGGGLPALLLPPANPLPVPPPPLVVAGALGALAAASPNGGAPYPTPPDELFSPPHSAAHSPALAALAQPMDFGFGTYGGLGYQLALDPAFPSPDTGLQPAPAASAMSTSSRRSSRGRPTSWADDEFPALPEFIHAEHTRPRLPAALNPKPPTPRRAPTDDMTLHSPNSVTHMNTSETTAGGTLGRPGAQKHGSRGSGGSGSGSGSGAASGTLAASPTSDAAMLSPVLYSPVAAPGETDDPMDASLPSPGPGPGPGPDAHQDRRRSSVGERAGGYALRASRRRHPSDRGAGGGADKPPDDPHARAPAHVAYHPYAGQHAADPRRAGEGRRDAGANAGLEPPRPFFDFGSALSGGR